MAAGETVLDVPATLAARVRVLGTGRSDKNDPNDARSVAIAALRAPALAQVRAEDHVSVLRLLAKRHGDLGRARNRTACRLHAIVAELVAGGIDKELVTSQVRALIDGLEATTATQQTRLEIAAELTDDLARLDNQIKASKRRLGDAVEASGSLIDRHLRDRPGAAAMIIGYTGDPTRFANPNAYANYNGTAPIERSSGGRASTGSRDAGTANSTTPSTWPRSPRSATPTAPAAATTTPSSPRARPRRKRCER